MTTAFVLDTMMWLHFRPVDDVDWRAILATRDNVHLVVPRITVRELNEHKDRPASQRIRERARKALVDLEAWAVAGKLTKQPEITCSFYRTPPAFDFKTKNLDPNWGDDQLLASILQYQHDHPDHAVVLVTDDTGARLAAGEFGIRTVSAPDEMRVPVEADPLEKEVQSLRREIQKLTHALPKLDLRFKGATQVLRVRLSPATKPKESLDEVMAKLRVKYQPAAREQQFALGGLSLVPETEHERYRVDLARFLADYEAYFKENWGYFEEQSRGAWIDLELANSGTAPAEDIDIELHFPDGLTIRAEDDDSLHRPEPPEAPTRPRTTSEMLRDSFSNLNYLSHYSQHFPDIRSIASNVSPLTIRETNSVLVHTHVERIKHGATEEIPRIHVTFEPHAIKSFSIDCVLRPGSPPSESSKGLDVVVEQRTD